MMIPPNPPLIAYPLILAVALAAALTAAALLRRLGSMRLPWGGTDRRWDWLAGLSLVLYTALFTVLTLRQQAALQTTWDLALYSNALWNTLQGRFLYSGMLNDAVNYFGTHFSPILLLFLPLYAVWDRPETLLIAQTLLLALGGVPIYLLAARRLGHKAWGLLFLLAYLLYPGLQATNLDMFHGMALLAPLLTWGLFFLLEGRIGLFLVCVGLMWATREDTPIITFALGVYIWLILRRARLGLVLAALSALWGIVVLQVIVPAFRTPGDYLHATALYSYLGDGLGEIVLNLLSQPGLVAAQVLQGRKLSFILYLWVPVGLLCLAGPRALATLAVSLPSLAILLLADFWVPTSVDYHYAAPILPFVFVAAILGTAWLKDPSRRPYALPKDEGEGENPPATRRGHRRGPILAVYLLAAVLASYLLLAPGPLSRRFDGNRYRPDERSRLMTEAIAQLAPDEALLVNRRFYPQLTRREHIFSFPDPRASLPVDAIALDTLGPENTPPSFPHVLESAEADRFPRFDLAWEQDQVKIWRPNGEFVLDQPVAAQFADGFELLRWGLATAEGRDIHPGDAMQVALSWRADQAPARRYAFFVHLVKEGDRWLNLWAQADQEPAGGLHPTHLWSAGQLFGDGYTLSLPADLPPGEYQLIAGIFALDDLQRLPRVDGPGNVARLGSVRVDPATAPVDAGELSIPIRLDFPAAPGLALLGHSPPTADLRPGELLAVQLFWQAAGPIDDDYAWRVSLVDAAAAPDSASAATWLVEPAGGHWPTSAWQQGTALRDWLRLPLPSETPGGDYRVTVQAVQGDGRSVGEAIDLGPVRVDSRPRLFEPPPLPHGQRAEFGDQIALLGYDLPQSTVTAGESLPLTLVWQAMAATDTSFTVFVHLLDESEQVWGQVDRLPAGDYPTAAWLPGEVVLDGYELPVAEDAPPGTYRIEVGLYDAATGKRLPVSGGGDRVLLDRPVTVER